MGAEMHIRIGAGPISFPWQFFRKIICY